MIRGWVGIIIACVVAFLLQQRLPPLESQFALWSPQVTWPPFRPWQIVTHGLLHTNWGHLFVNMFGLFMFGHDVERLMGRMRFLLYFFVCVACGGLAHLAVMPLLGVSNWVSVGASGGVLAVVAAFGVAFPRRKVLLVFPPIPMPAWVLVTLYVFFDLFSGIYNRGSGVGHFAHLGGMLGGLMLCLVWLKLHRGARDRSNV